MAEFKESFAIVKTHSEEKPKEKGRNKLRLIIVLSKENQNYKEEKVIDHTLNCQHLLNKI